MRGLRPGIGNPIGDSNRQDPVSIKAEPFPADRVAVHEPKGSDAFGAGGVEGAAGSGRAAARAILDRLANRLSGPSTAEPGVLSRDRR